MSSDLELKYKGLPSEHDFLDSPIFFLVKKIHFVIFSRHK